MNALDDDKDDFGYHGPRLMGPHATRILHDDSLKLLTTNGVILLEDCADYPIPQHNVINLLGAHYIIELAKAGPNRYRLQNHAYALAYQIVSVVPSTAAKTGQ